MLYWFLGALGREFDFEPPRHHGYDSVAGVRAMRDGRAKVFIGVAGNFVRAMSDSDVTEAALRSCSLTLQISTKLNRSHAVCGETALILPTLGRNDRDVQASGEQFVSVEDSMSEVHQSRGRLAPASPHLLREVAIIGRLARRTLGLGGSIPWEEFEQDYALRVHPRAGAAEVAAQQQEVDDLADGRDAVPVLGETHRPAHDHPTARQHLAMDGLDLLAGQSGGPELPRGDRAQVGGSGRRTRSCGRR